MQEMRGFDRIGKKMNQMTFNRDKCKILLSVSKKKKINSIRREKNKAYLVKKTWGF